MNLILCLDCNGTTVLKAYVLPSDDLFDLGFKIDDLSQIMEAGKAQGSDVLFKNPNMIFTFFGPSNSVFNQVSIPF